MSTRQDTTTDTRPAQDAPRRAPLLILLAAFAVLRAVSLATHEMWRDELQAWGVANDTPGIGAFVTALRAEGHPPLWYLLLRGLGAVWPDPVAMQVLTWAVAVGVAAIVLLCAPAPVWVRCAVLLGYHVGYEYAVLARSYALGLLLLVAALAAITTRRPRRRLAAVLLAGLALTSAFGAALAIGLAAAMLLDTRRIRSSVAVLTGLVAVVAVAAIAVRGLFGDNPALASGGVLRRGYYASRGLLALFPIPDRLPPLWGYTALDTIPGPIALAALVAAAAALAWGLRGDPPAVAAWLVSFGLVELIAITTEAVYLRHLGHLVLALLAALWFARRPGAPVRAGHRVADAVGLVVIIAGLIGGPPAVAADIGSRFSPAEAMADYLADALPPDAQVLADADFGTAGVAITLDRPFFLPATGTTGTYVRWTDRRCKEVSNNGGCVPRAEILTDAQRLAADGDGPVWLLLNYRFDDPRLELVHTETGGMVTGEDQYAYRLLPAE